LVPKSTSIAPTTTTTRSRQCPLQPAAPTSYNQQTQQMMKPCFSTPSQRTDILSRSRKLSPVLPNRQLSVTFVLSVSSSTSNPHCHFLPCPWKWFPVLHLLHLLVNDFSQFHCKIRGGLISHWYDWQFEQESSISHTHYQISYHLSPAMLFTIILTPAISAPYSHNILVPTVTPPIHSLYVWVFEAITGNEFDFKYHSPSQMLPGFLSYTDHRIYK